MRESGAPGVQHERGADLSAQAPRVRGDGTQRFGGDIKQQPVDDVCLDTCRLSECAH